MGGRSGHEGFNGCHFRWERLIEKKIWWFVNFVRIFTPMMSNTNKHNMLTPPTTYGEAYTVNNSFLVTYLDWNQLYTVTNLVVVIETRTTKTGRIAPKFQNFATGRVWWGPAKNPDTPCKHIECAPGICVEAWKYDGTR